MIIYEREISDGLANIIKAKSSISIASSIVDMDKKFITNQKLLDSIETAKAKIGNPDLYLVPAILVTTNWNENEDVFLKEPVWAARHTPEDKPANLEHVETDIIGHIVSNDCYTEDAQLIDDNSKIEDVPDVFNIVTSTVVYKHWEDEKRQEQIDTLIAEIEEGKADPAKAKWAVSMECLFSNFDYAVMEPNGRQYVIARTKDTAYLTKYLKAYGGNGVYNGKRVGRALKNMIFSGKGFTTNPANKKSVILKSGASKQIFVPNYSGSIIMDEKMVEELKATVAKLNAEKDGLVKQIAENKDNAVSAKITSLESELASAKKVADDNAKKLAEVVKSNEELTTANTKYVKELSDLASKAKTQNRVSKLVEAGLSKEDATAKATKFDSLDDEMFEEIVSMSTATVKAEAAAKKAADEAKKPVVKPVADKSKASEETVETEEEVEVTEVEETTEAALENDVEIDNKLVASMIEFLN